jgi:hypothetical protein
MPLEIAMSATQRILSAALREAEPLCLPNDQVVEGRSSSRRFGFQKEKYRLIKDFRYGTASLSTLCGFLLPLILKDRISVIVAFFLPYWFLSQLARMQHRTAHPTN